jgi:hypothetical protein
MKVALFYGGMPRFTPDFLLFMRRLNGFDQADLYMNLWKTDWAENNDVARKKIEKILSPCYNLVKVNVIDEPAYQLPPHKLYHPDPAPENIKWLYKRQIAQWRGNKFAFDLIDQEYDAYIKFRPDGSFLDDVDISLLDLKNNELIFPDYGRAGWDDFRTCDLLWFGNKEGSKFITRLADVHDELIPVSDPNWELDRHGTWTSEFLMGTYMKLHNKKFAIADCKFHINLTSGRSRYTDKHYHHPIAIDPTELNF